MKPEKAYPAIPLSAPDVGPAEIEAVTRVLQTSQFSLGPQLEAFEREFAQFHQAPEAVAVSSGTTGLHLALLLESIGPGDEVIVPSFTFVAVANAVLQVGATPVFAEIDPVTLNLDATYIEAAITARTKAILVVHTFGVPANMTPVIALSQRYGLALIEDACEALGATYKGQPVGTLGASGVFGFYPNKQITTGEGGALLVHDAARAKRLRSLRNQGRIPGGDWLDHSEPGYNYRLSEMACALGRVQLRRLSEFLELRANAAHRYDHLLRGIDSVDRPLLTLEDATISWFVYVVRLPAAVDRDRIQAIMAQDGIATGRYFPPIHLQPAWSARGHGPAVHLPVTEAIARRTLALPFFNRITLEQQERVANSLKKAIAVL